MKLLALTILLIPAVTLYGEWRSLSPQEQPDTDKDRQIIEGQLVEPNEWQKLDPSAEWRTERPAVNYRLLGQSDWTHGVWFVRKKSEPDIWRLVVRISPEGITTDSLFKTWAECAEQMERSRTCSAGSWKPCTEIAQ